MHSLRLRTLTLVSFTAILSVCASCAQMIEVDASASSEGTEATGGSSGSADAGTSGPGTGTGGSGGRWVVVSLSTGECVFRQVGVHETIPDAPPVGSCHPCPTPVGSPADHAGTTCELANLPRCIYEGGTTTYLDCTPNADGSLTFVWSTAP